MTEGEYSHVYVIMELEGSRLVPVSLEMLGEARRLINNFNKKYESNEKVVAILLGHNVKDFIKTLIEYGADYVIYVDHPELKDVRNIIYTKVISQIAQDKEIAAKISADQSEKFKKPRYMFFAAD